MRLLAKFWQNFKIQPDIWFFYGFILTFTLSVRKLIYYYPINGNFNEYTGIYLYLSDIFLFLTILAWAISILESKSLFLSRRTLAIPLFLVLWTFISIIWSENHWIVIFKSIKVLEFFLLFTYIIQKVSLLPARKMLRACPSEKCSTWNIFGRVEHFWESGTFLRNSLLVISISGLIQSIIGIIQVFLQHSIGLFWLKESLISPEIPGVAKIILDGERYIRAYGLFPHPNILGGFLVFSIITTIYLLKVLRLPTGKLFHVEQFWEDRTFLKRFLINSLGIQIIGLILTFSKSSILGLIIALAYLAYKKLFHVEQFKRKLLIVLVLLALIVVIAKPSFYSVFQKSLEERALGYKVVYNTSEMFRACPPEKCSTWNNFRHFRGGTFITNPIAGLGQGRFVLEMQKYIPQKLETWQFQPVHNVFLLILSELGF
ncbi:O-antigen ligase family protein, partial [Patescibacteria group bacterium]|nr:O-antigen ligase family protein [Patescibacteria group bacterium]